MNVWKQQPHRIVRLAFLCLFLVAAVGCSKEPAPPFRVGINLWPGYEFLYLAQEKGFLKDRGVDIRLVEFNSLSDARRAFERGQLEALATTIVEVLQIRDQSKRRPQIVRVLDYSNGADKIIASPSFKTFADLKGARFGVELASLGVYILARGLELHGIKLDEINAYSMDQLSIDGAFRSGVIDAAVTYPPISTNLLGIPGTSTLFSTTEIPGEVVDVLAVDSDTILRDRERVAVVVDGINRAIAFSKTSPAEAHAIMARREGIAPQAFAEALSQGVVMLTDAEQQAYLGPEGKLLPLIRNAARILKEVSQLTNDTVSDDVINPSFIN
ncbi:MAG: hypothetical protein EBZ48_10875 [Proteobacteria bacterium]|nr:hypothetical protein [Pseudomonadota bacterium]